MPNTLYVYGIVKNGPNFKYNGLGLNEECVYTLKQGEFSALVHDCEEKPYISKDPARVKELIIAHNNVLSKAMKSFKGVMPLPFNTIIKGGEKSAEDNLRGWLNDNKERLSGVWDKINNKREYGIRIFYDKSRLMQESSGNAEIKRIEKSQEGKGEGLSYLLKSKASYQISEIANRTINQFKQKFYDDLKSLTEDVRVTISRISLDEEKDLLLNLSILVDETRTDEIRKILEKNKGFSFELVGPFAPYSFVEK